MPVLPKKAYNTSKLIWTIYPNGQNIWDTSKKPLSLGVHTPWKKNMTAIGDFLLLRLNFWCLRNARGPMWPYRAGGTRETGGLLASPPLCVQMDFTRKFQTNIKFSNINHVWIHFYKLLVVLKYHRCLWVNIFNTNVCRSITIPKKAKYAGGTRAAGDTCLPYQLKQTLFQNLPWLLGQQSPSFGSLLAYLETMFKKILFLGIKLFCFSR